MKPIVKGVIRQIRQLFSVKRFVKLPAPETVDYETALAFFCQRRDAYEEMCDYISTKVSPTDTIVDVGANIGFFSLMLMEKIGFQGEAHLFEPIPNLANLCRQTFSEKTWNVNVHPYALGDRDGKALIYMAADGNIGWSTLEREKTQRGMKPLWIEIRRFDGLGIREMGLVKIDVEGAEYKVINGMLSTLKVARRLPLLVVEIGWGKDSHPHWNESLASFTELFKLGYKAVDFNDQKVDVSSIDRTCDVVFLPSVCSGR